MPVNQTRYKPILGYMVPAGGTMSLTGRNYASQRIVSTPDQKSRPHPIDVSQFSLSNTPRTYYTITDTDSGWTKRVDPYGNLYAWPTAWSGGCGYWGLSTPNYSPGLDLASKVKDQKANLGITLAKYRELCTLWSGFTGQILDTAAGLQRLDAKRRRNRSMVNSLVKFHPLAKAAFTGASAIYLGYLFGLRQFVQDFDAVSKALRRRFDDPIYQDVYFSKNFFDEVTREGNRKTPEHWRSIASSTSAYKVRARYRVFPNEQVLAQMGMTNPLAMIYDFIPFSFVLNWMIPIGKYIAALDALEGISDFRWYYTRKDGYMNWVTNPTLSSDPAYYTMEAMYRSGVNTNLNVRFPRFEPSRFSSNVLTGVALLGALNNKPSTGRAILRIR